MYDRGQGVDVTAPELVRWLVATGKTRQQIAERLGVSRRAIYGWATGTMRPTPQHFAALEAFAHEQPVHAAAARAAGEGRLRPWERRPIVRPSDCYEQDVVWL